MTVKLKRKWKHYGLRTCSADGTSQGGFVWPLKGAVECPDWKPTEKCGNGFHALLNGLGDAGLVNTGDVRWQLVGFDEYVDLGGKVKFPRCEVATGTQIEITTALASLCGVTGHYGTATAGHYGTATAGYYGTATAGYSGTATAGDRGTATAGDRGTATAGYYGTATAGDSGTATAGDSGTATAGDRGTATAGYYGTATAGDSGAVMVKWWDGKRYKFAIGYVGEGGIKPNTPYKADAKGKLVEAKQ
jgi:hypothetical protein